MESVEKICSKVHILTSVVLLLQAVIQPPLLQLLQFVINCPQIICGHKPSFHDCLHVTPCTDRLSTGFLYLGQNTIPPTQSITIKLGGSKLELPVLGIIIQTPYFLHL